MRKPFRSSAGFTLIELLIVVAIIAILAAIAVPNFLEAQTRSKIARIRGDFNAIAVALEQYAMETAVYIPDGFSPIYAGFAWEYPNDHEGCDMIWSRLTTPAAYMTSIAHDPFYAATYAQDFLGRGAGERNPANRTFRYYTVKDWGSASGAAPDDFFGKWIVVSPGPDKIYNYGEWIMHKSDEVSVPRKYDPTNGTISGGDIVRWGP